ncbi:hypothetical protein B7P43_G00619 [Cryptotermes secundus]|uniref:Uncharacterized protein n=1 Tax=Cryptotermes secundus TaxID=105785 RepID=A0A2J7PUZ3_9NEOP|nr:hypothetical protein B7P43_G00619 [Cryptotermes secundus]
MTELTYVSCSHAMCVCVCVWHAMKHVLSIKGLSRTSLPFDLHKIKVWFEPTDVRKAGKVFQSRHWTTLGYVSPNLNELQVMSQASVTPPPVTLKRPPVKDPANRLEGGLKIHKLVHVPPSNKKKNGATRKCCVCGKHKIRKETSVMCVSCGVALCKLSCFNVYHTKKNY